jgi:hypothetical protein
MTDVGSPRPETSPVAYGTERRSTRWTGWIVFAAFLMFMNGVLGMLEGLMALVNDDYYAVTASGLAVSVDYTVWGWGHLVLGAALFACGMGVLSGNIAARAVGVLLAGLHAVVALLFIEAAPGWGVVIILVNVLVIYALTVHGREMRDYM